MSTCCKIHDQVDRVTTCNLPTEVTVLLASVLEAAELDTMVLDSTVGETMVEVLVLVTVLRVLEAPVVAAALPT